MSRNAFYEFFAGGGMARVGLGPAWDCLFANDFDAGKAACYRANFGGDDFREGDVWALAPADLPGRADLAWASSPCQDFSLAGARAGLSGERSGAFFGFWRLIEGLAAEGRAPEVVVIENVAGLLSSAGGADFRGVCQALAAQGYRFGALEIDAARFLAQSRPRLFLIATRRAPPAELTGESPFQTPKVRAAQAALPEALARCWVWWACPAPGARNADLAAVLEPDGDVRWRSHAATTTLLALMASPHRVRLEAARREGRRIVGGLYRRVRLEDGVRRQRAEVRFDGLAGCLRTPKGGSSRQSLVVVEGRQVRSRLVSAREGARLMGLPDSYRLPAGETAAWRVVGDGVAVPVVRWLAERLIEPLLAAGRRRVLAAE